jgi:hypothetical protein
VAALKRSAKATKLAHGTYRVTAETTAQAMRIADEYRHLGWTCSSRGRRLVLTTYTEAYLSPRTPVLLWQLDKAPHEEASRQWLVPELRGRRSDSAADASAGLQGEERDAGDQEIKDDHGE